MNDKEYNDTLEEIFELLAPGKELRNAVDRIQEASLGALIVLGDPAEFLDIVEGGFELNTAFTAQKLYELAKMDGGVIVSRNIEKIYGANLHFQPNHEIKTEESGTRHRTAHRIAIQTGKIVVTISERRSKVTVFKGDFRYTLDSTADILIKSSQATMTLEKYSSSINAYLSNLNFLEYAKIGTIEDVVKGVKYYSLLFNMDKRIMEYIRELGTEGKLLQLQHDQIMQGHKDNFLNLIKDYTNHSVEKSDKIMEKLIGLDKFISNEDSEIIKLLGYDPKQVVLEDSITAKGYRFLSSVKNLYKKDIENIIEYFNNDITQIMDASNEELQKVRGVSKIKAATIIRLANKHKNFIELERTIW